MSNNKTETEFKTIRVGDSILAFNGTEKTSIQKADNPELFQIIINLLKENNQDKIKDILFNIDKQIENSFEGRIKIENGKVFYDTIELPEIVSKKIISIYSSGNTDFEPITRFYEKLKMASKNQEKINRILNSIFSYDKSNIYFTKSGNIVVKAICDSKHAKNTMFGKSSSGIVNIYLFDNEKLSNDSNGEYYLISPMDILRTEICNIYIHEGTIANSQSNYDNEDETPMDFTKLILRRARKLKGNFKVPKGIFAEVDFEDLYDITFEFMKQLNKTY